MPLTIFGVISVALGLYLWIVPWASTSIGPFYGPKALTNPYLAAEMFLDAHGVEITKYGNASNLAAATARADVLLMTNQNGDFSSEQLENLFEWLEAGGKLIYQPTTLYGGEDKYVDRVLERTTQRLATSENKKRLHTPTTDVHHSDVDCPESSETTSIYFGPDRVLQVDMARGMVLVPTTGDDSESSMSYAEPNWKSADFVILTGLRQWRNNLIQCHDNAQFLHDIVIGESEAKIQLGWLDGAETQPLYQHLWQWFPYSTVTLAFLLLWWLWNRIPRDQPMRVDTERRENALEDYLMRKAIFRWRYANSLEQLNPLRAEILGRTKTDFTELEYERLSQTTGQGVDVITSALKSNTWLGHRELTKLVATLSRIRGIN